MNENTNCLGRLYTKIFNFLSGLDIFGDNYIINFWLFTPLMIFVGLPVSAFEYLLDFMEFLPGNHLCVKAFLYVTSIMICLFKVS